MYVQGNTAFTIKTKNQCRIYLTFTSLVKQTTKFSSFMNFFNFHVKDSKYPNSPENVFEIFLTLCKQFHKQKHCPKIFNFFFHLCWGVRCSCHVSCLRAGSLQLSLSSSEYNHKPTLGVFKQNLISRVFFLKYKFSHGYEIDTWTCVKLFFFEIKLLRPWL